MMKTLYKIPLICLAILSFAGCKQEDIDLYKGASSIYFPEKETKDKNYFSFGYVSSFIQDTTLYIPVMATGAVTDFDRPYKLSIGESSTLTGEDYEILNETFVIPAGQLTDVLVIKVNRTEALRLDTLTLDLSLQPNEFFTNDLNYVTVGTGVNAYQRPLYRLEVQVDDIVGVPPFWNPVGNPAASVFIGYLGTFSGKKFQIMIGMFGLNVEEVTKPNYRPAATLLIAWARTMQAYLNQMAANGTPVMEEDGVTPMKMGQYVQ